MGTGPATPDGDFDTGATGTPVSPALNVREIGAWDATCDVLVIGCGLAGASTALKAAEVPGTTVTIADRFSGGGGSALSGGVVYAGSTHVQERLGVSDDTKAMVDYLRYETDGIVGEPTLERFCRDSATFLPWLEKYGAKFGGPFTPDKTSYPHNGFLYFSGNERLPECEVIAPPAPRGHRTKPMDGSDTNEAVSGASLMAPLIASIDSSPAIDFLRRASARRLIVDDAGAVVGAELWQVPPRSFAARLHDRLARLSGNMMLTVLGLNRPLLKVLIDVERRFARPHRVRASKAVILANGGFGFNPGMLAREAPLYRHIAPIGTIGDDGSGIWLGRSAGASTDRMGTASAWRFLYPPQVWTKGVLIGLSGERLLNEEAYGSRTGAAIFERSQGRAWLILDKPLLDIAKQQAAEPELAAFQKYALKAALGRYATTAGDLKTLGEKIGVGGATLAATIGRYNGDIEGAKPDQFGKSDKLRRPIVEAPFTAVELSAYTKLNPILGITVGGLRVDERSGAVLSQERPIPNLYAAGRVAVGIPSNFYVSGLSLADCVWSGWRAAASATRQGVGETEHPATAAFTG